MKLVHSKNDGDGYIIFKLDSKVLKPSYLKNDGDGYDIKLLKSIVTVTTIFKLKSSVTVTM